MGKGKKPQDEQEVLGQIFDFIFAQAKKDPKKRKPIKIKSTGISTSGAVVDGVVAALEKPGVFVTDQSLGILNDALTIEFGRMKADELGVAKAKFTTSNIADFLKDPNKFLNKPFESAKAARKSSAVAFMGKTIEGFQALAWANKYNLDLDAKKAIAGSYTARSIGKKGEADRAFATAAGAIATGTMTSEKNHLASRSADLIGRELFGREGWELMSHDRKDDFRKSLQNGTTNDYLATKYGGGAYGGRYVGILQARYDALRKAGGMEKAEINLFNENQYLWLENRNIESRIADMETYLKRNPNLSKSEVQNINQGIKKLQNAEVLISGKHFSLKDVAASRKSLEQKIKTVQGDLKLARKSGDKNKVRDCKAEIKFLKSNVNQLGWMSFWGNIGTAEGKINSVKSVMGGGNAIISILDGSFYDKNMNTTRLLPCQEKKITLGSHKMRSTDLYGNVIMKGEKNIPAESEQITIFVAGDNAKSFIGRSYNKMMTDMYYWTPKSIMKTLFVNGEGFIYKNYKQSLALAKQLGMDPSKAKYEDIIKQAMAMGNKYKFQLASLSATRRLSTIFSFAQRKRDMVKSWFDQNVYRKLRQRVYNSLIGKIRDGAAKTMLNEWLVNGGFQVMAKALTSVILNALGMVATGGLGAFIAPFLSAIVSDILYKGAAVIIQFALIILCGVIGLVWFASDSSKKSFDSQTYAYTNVVPGEVVDNPNYTGTNPITGEDDPDHELDPFVGGTLPDGEKCLLGSGSYHCSQGPYGSYSHQNVAAIDVTGVDYFYAPVFCGNENCTVTYSGSAYCGDGYAGGMLKFTATYGGDTYEFTLIHINSTYGVGSKLSSGQRVARVMTIDETTRACSSGKHIHIQARMNGAIVNPRDVLTAGASKGGFACNISECDP